MAAHTLPIRLAHSATPHLSRYRLPEVLSASARYDIRKKCISEITRCDDCLLNCPGEEQLVAKNGSHVQGFYRFE